MNQIKHLFKRDKAVVEAAGTPEVAKAVDFSRGPLKIKEARFNLPIWAKAWISLIPAMIFLLAFMIYPIINTTIISFMENFAWQRGAGSFAFSNFFQQLENSLNPDLLTPVTAPRISLKNYISVFTDRDFQNSIVNTVILVLVSVPLTIGISLVLAVLLNSIKKLQGLYQTIFFLPYVTNSIALGMVFNVMFSASDGGLMNQFLSIFGLDPRAWIYAAQGATKFTMGVAITVSTVWNGLAFKILVFMSGLASIDKQYYDAARIDGTPRGRIFAKITVPLLSPQILYITITSFIGAFKAYSGIIAIFGQGATNYGGGDGKAWMTIVGYIYNFRDLKLPYAAAGSVILLLLILLITLVQFQVSKRRVHY